MGLFRKRKTQTPAFFEEEPLDERFNLLAEFVRELGTKADFNKAVGAMEDIFNAYQRLRGIKTYDDEIDNSMKFALHKEEGK